MSFLSRTDSRLCDYINVMLTPQNRKDIFLNSMHSKSQYKYKPYKGLPLRYAGGKSRAVAHIIEHIPPDIPNLVSPFFGGGSVEIVCNRELGIAVQGYDIFRMLTNYWQIQINRPRELALYLSQWQPTPEKYKEIKARLKKQWEGNNLIENAVVLAAHYWFNHNLSYGPAFLGWLSKIYHCPKRYEKAIGRVREFQTDNRLTVDTGSFDETIPRHPKSFLYCDPPYYLQEGSVFKGIYPQRNFPIYHKDFDHERLFQLLDSHPSGFVLSYNDCPIIREWYKDYEIHEGRWQYSLGQGETRIGKNRKASESGHVKKSSELIIVKRN